MQRIDTFTREWETIESKMVFNRGDIEVSSETSRNLFCNTQFKASWWTELTVLLNRNLRDLFRNVPLVIANIVQAIVIMLMLGFIYFKMDNEPTGVQNRIGFLYFLCINQTFNIVVQIISVFPLQRIIIRRERAAGSYRASSAFVAKWISTIPLLIFTCLILIIPVYFMAGLQLKTSKFLIYLVVNLVHVMTANSLGLFIGASVKDIQIGQIIGPLVVVLFLLFGGPVLSLRTTPWVLRWIMFISPIANSNKALSQNEFIGLDLQCTDPTGVCYANGEQALFTFSLGTPTIWTNVGINAALTFAFLILAWIQFSRTSRPLIRLK